MVFWVVTQYSDVVG